MIYAQLLKTLLETAISIEDLFPVDFDEVLYGNFPPSTQGSTGWGGSFQTYVDNLFEKGLIESQPCVDSLRVLRRRSDTNHRVGQLAFATSIGMRPEHSFGVQGHTLYVFVYESNDSHEISIMAPAQSGVFHQILDIPVRSIRELTIVTDEYSQIASQIGLELRSGKGHEFFLDSEKIELSSVYLTFQPGHVEDFRKELVGRCPGLKVAQADKEAATKPSSSESQNHRSQVSVSDVIMSRDPDEEQAQEQPSSIIPQEPRLRKNSVRETQAEQDKTQRSVDVGDEQQTSVDGLKAGGAAQQITEELSEITPASNALDFKKPMAPKLKVKPKAKPPITPRALRNKLVQASPQKPADATQPRTRGKQEQNGSTTTSQEKSASQGVRGQQKQSEQAVNFQNGTANHVNKVSATSQPRMPPPNSKANGKTRSTQSTQVTDDIEDWEVPEEPKKLSNGTRKATANATKTSKGGHSPGYQQFSDDYITEVDERDASTPKVTVAESQARNKTATVPITNTYSKKLGNSSSTVSRKQKRYSLPAPAKSTPISGDAFDIPPDPKEDENSQNTKGEKSTKAGKSNPRTAGLAKTAIDTKPKAATKKRQSAPGALNRSAGTRNSQRAAAAKANEQLRGADKSDVEDAEVDEEPAPVISQAGQKGKMKTRQGVTKFASEVEVDDEVAPTTEVVQEMSPLPLPAIPPPSPVRNETIERVAGDNLDVPTPKLLPKKLPSQKPQETTVKESKESAKVSKTSEKKKPKEKGIASALDMASKLGDILDDVSDNLSETEPQTSTVRKQFVQSTVPKTPKPMVRNEDAPAAENPTESAPNQTMEFNSKSKTPVLQPPDSSSLPPLKESEIVEVSPHGPKQITAFVSQETPKANDDEIFKKPDIPTHRKKTAIRPDDSEPLTAERESVDEAAHDEPEQDVATSEHVNRSIAEGAQDTPAESVCDNRDTAEIGRKRKIELIATTPPKRQRVDESQARAQASPAPSPPSSPPFVGKMITMQTKKSQKATEKIASPRRSPRLMDRARQATEALQKAISEGNSAAKDPNRKPHLVSFGINGALNQGISSTSKVCKDPPSSKNVPEPQEAPKPVRDDVGKKKRKGEQLELLDAENRSSKRQSVSPRDCAIMNAYEEDDLPVLPDDSSAEVVKTKSAKNRHSTKLPTRLSSQTSRVDKNGSPMGSSQEDHFGKLQKRLAAEKTGNKSQAPSPPPAESPVIVQPRRLSQIFGPRVVLENKSKARNSSPEETAARYVAHEKTVHGLYQEVATKQVVAPEKKIQDPFTEKTRKSNGFTERLMSGSLRGNNVEVSKPSESTMTGGKGVRRDAQHALPLHTRGTPRADLAESAKRAQKFRVRQKGRVNVEEQPLSDGSTPSEMTLGTSYESISSEPEQMPLDEKQNTAAVWNVALRPHYNSLHEAVHRIADVSTPSCFHLDNANA